MKRNGNCINASFILLAFILVVKNSKSQSISSYRPDQINTITTAVPFLMITPDSRAGGMGDVGVATSTDVNSIHWNPSKLGFADKKMAIGISYTPWLRALVPDINMAYLSGYYKTKKSGTVGASLRYFSLGTITFTDVNGQKIIDAHPNEYTFDIAYATKLGKDFSAGGAVRYIRSDLTNGAPVQGISTHPGNAVAVDISALYKKTGIKLSDKKATGAIGLNISNIGQKMSYSDGGKNSDFIPINLRLGGSLDIQLDDYNSLMISADVNKLLVPTPPIYKHETDSLGHETNVIELDANNDPVIEAGENPNKGVAEGIFHSFSDAPGGGKEELREINYSVGMEYWYNKLFALRFGYFYENPTKGNRQFFTLGAGIKYNVFGLDFAYLIPTKQRNPLENTLRFSLTFDLDAFKAQNDEKSAE
ncbi:MAG TPA: type IX secretion system outer membrane channel protein PorV [Bacteroidia bacterium]|nr:type IX secretion system outer membrane channel protein PorV [Bacteroidia bacterium]